MKRKIGICVLAALFLLVVCWMVGTGLRPRHDVMLTDFALSADGSRITLQTAVASSMGYVRDFRDDGGGVKPHYLTFYATFGGWNSALGSASAFTLELAPEDTEIYFSRPGGGYVLVLEKDSQTGQWSFPAD